MLPKPSKESAIRYIQKALPEYGWILSKIHKDGGWIKFESWLDNVLNKWKPAMTRTGLNSGKRRRQTNNLIVKLETFQRFLTPL